MPSRATSALLVVAMLTTGVAGCLTDDGSLDSASTATGDPLDLSADRVTDGLERLLEARREPRTIQENVTVNVVLVGIDRDLVDTEQIASNLPKTYSPNVDFAKPREGLLRSGVAHQIDYAFHEAPDAFAEELFSQYERFSREVELAGPANATSETSFLERYDRMYGLDRADGTEHLVDATAVEAWIHAHRAEHGLEFEEPEATVFFLDSWTDHGLWEDDYYRYEFPQDTDPNSETRTLRAWGGTYDFLFMDYSAAPNEARDDNSNIQRVNIFGGASQPVPAAEGTAYNDPPMWHYDGDTATIGKGPLEKTVELTDRIEHALDVGVNLRLLGDYAFRPIYNERYHVNVHLWHDGRSQMPTEDLEQYIDRERLEGSLQQEVPWSNLTVSLDTYVAPEDDPGMARALEEAKAEGAGSYLPINPVWQHVDANQDRYDDAPEDAFSINALMFLLEGHYAFVLPVIVGGVAFSGPDGTAWGTISSVNDHRYVQNGMDMEETARSLVGINAHEVGHFFGLPHAHDGSRRTSDGYEPFLEHTWSSTRTIMSYRMNPYSADTFHVELLAKAHMRENLRHTLRNVESVYRALDADGLAETPDPVRDALGTASDARQQAIASFQQGSYRAAVDAAIEAREASEDALDLVGVAEAPVRVASWTNEGVDSVGVRWSAVALEPAVVPTGVEFDYRPVNLTEDVESITVRASWNNTPSSWGDFFIGWSRSQTEPVVNQGPVAYGSPISLGGGIHDPVAEGPTDGQVTRSFTLDIDDFPVFRELDELYMGAGTRGRAVDGAYQVDITVTYRDHGDGTVPDGVDATEQGTGELVERPVELHAPATAAEQMAREDRLDELDGMPAERSAVDRLDPRAVLG